MCLILCLLENWIIHGCIVKHVMSVKKILLRNKREIMICFLIWLLDSWQHTLFSPIHMDVLLPCSSIKGQYFWKIIAQLYPFNLFLSAKFFSSTLVIVLFQLNFMFWLMLNTLKWILLILTCDPLNWARTDYPVWFLF